MPRSVTAGLDGSAESLAAAGWAAREATLRDVPLRLVHAWEWQPHAQAPLAVAEADTHRQWAERVVREAETELSRRYPGLRITVDQLAQQAAVPALLAAAEDADLLVLGSRALSGVAGFLLGSVALAVVARVERPVVLVRAGELAEDEHRPDAAGGPSATTPYRDVVLGLDVQQPSDEVIEFAFEAAARRAATLRVVHGWDLPPYYYGYGASLDPELNAEMSARERRRLTDVLRPWRQKFPAVEVNEQSVVGSPGPHLVDASSDAALMVVGRKNRHWPVGTHIGPVTHAVMHHSTAPVAVIPHG